MKELLTKAIKSNRNLNALVKMTPERINHLVEVAWRKEVAEGTDLIVEGDLFADHFYIVQEGQFDVLVAEGNQPHSEADNIARDGAFGEMENMRKVNTSQAGGSFGELALLYYAPRAATVKAMKPSVVWVINRSDFKSILLKASAAKIQEYTKLLDGLLADEKVAVAEALVEMHFQVDEYILQEGEMGNTFFILYDGEVQFITDGKEGDKVKAQPKDQ